MKRRGKMLNKKAQGMPMNVIIVAIIVLVVLVILIAFFAGGFGSVVGKVRELFTGQVSAQAKDAAIRTCESLCTEAETQTTTAQRNSGYCNYNPVVDHDINPDTPPRRMVCGPGITTPILDPKTQESDTKRGITSGGDLGVTCDVRCT